MLDMDFRVDDLFIGGAGAVSATPHLRARCVAPNAIERCEILRSVRPDGHEVEFEEIDRLGKPGEHWYMLRLKLVGDAGFNSTPGQNLDAHAGNSRYPHNLCRAQGVYAWSSPIWATGR